ncbi:MAG: hypothetical protein JSV10_03320 [Candidatus Zixiibacteriota bacterium]|nr:MAG: hypothetical protein JSV10_03320 [candidate division Zixibacteria bacterium]
MFTYCRVTLAAILVLSIIISCSKSTRTECPLRTPKADREAELIALCLSGEIVAPDNLYRQVQRDLAAIRAAFGDTFELIRRIEFWPPWVPGRLMIGFYDSTVQQIRAGEYHGWDQLNEEYHVAEIDTGILYIMGIVTLVFRGRLHPYRLEEIYEGLPGAWAVSATGYVGDGPNVHPRQTMGGLTYLFRNGWGDCPAGCINNEYWYFVLEANDPVFVGYWPEYREERQPEWWSEARLNRRQYCD